MNIIRGNAVTEWLAKVASAANPNDNGPFAGQPVTFEERRAALKYTGVDSLYGFPLPTQSDYDSACNSLESTGESVASNNSMDSQPLPPHLAENATPLTRSRSDDTLRGDDVEGCATNENEEKTGAAKAHSSLAAQAVGTQAGVRSRGARAETGEA
ncbi:unnamed protein product, partial [Mesorhabditis spiculigera]